MAKTIGILTGGGDVPGLNPCMKAVAYSAFELGYKMVGIRRDGAVYLITTWMIQRRMITM